MPDVLSARSEHWLCQPIAKKRQRPPGWPWGRKRKVMRVRHEKIGYPLRNRRVGKASLKDEQFGYGRGDVGCRDDDIRARAAERAFSRTASDMDNDRPPSATETMPG